MCQILTQIKFLAKKYHLFSIVRSEMIISAYIASYLDTLNKIKLSKPYYMTGALSCGIYDFLS